MTADLHPGAENPSGFGLSDDVLELVSALRRAQAVLRAADEALRKNRTPAIELASLRASESAVRARLELLLVVSRRGWKADPATLEQMERDYWLLYEPDGALPG